MCTWELVPIFYKVVSQGEMCCDNRLPARGKIRETSPEAKIQVEGDYNEY